MVVLLKEETQESYGVYITKKISQSLLQENKWLLRLYLEERRNPSLGLTLTT